MAKCDEGYLCGVCGQYVDSVVESDLYLRYVIGQVDPESLHTTPDKHIRCNPTLSQFIVADDFSPVTVEGDFSKSQLDAGYVAQQEELVTQGWRRLNEIKDLGDVSILDIPLPGVLRKFDRQS